MRARERASERETHPKLLATCRLLLFWSVASSTNIVVGRLSIWLRCNYGCVCICCGDGKKPGAFAFSFVSKRLSEWKEKIFRVENSHLHRKTDRTRMRDAKRSSKAIRWYGSSHTSIAICTYYDVIVKRKIPSHNRMCMNTRSFEMPIHEQVTWRR